MKCEELRRFLHDPDAARKMKPVTPQPKVAEIGRNMMTLEEALRITHLRRRELQNREAEMRYAQDLSQDPSPVSFDSDGMEDFPHLPAIQAVLKKAADEIIEIIRTGNEQFLER